MKIIVFFNSMAPAGGIERVISKHINFLSKGHEIVLLTCDDQKSFYTLPNSVKHESLSVDFNLDMNSRFRRILQVGIAFIKVANKLRKKIRHHSPDIIYVASPLGLLQVCCTTFSPKSIYVTEHSSFLSYNFVYKRIALLLYKHVGLLTVPTTDDSKFYTSKKIKNFYVPNPLPFFPNSTSGLKNKVVLNVGRFTDDKRHELLLELWSRIQNKDEGWVLIIIGKGENEQKIKNKIEQLKLNETVVLLPPTKEIEKEYINASIFALTSRAEGFGLVLAEAQACGVPCISFNCPSGPKDIIIDGINGFLIEEDNHTKFIKKLDELMSDFDLRKRLGIQSRNDVSRFNEEKVSLEINNLLLKCFTKS